jgi:hypothetical protein
MSCATSVTCYFFYYGFINLFFFNIKILSSDFYFNGIGLVFTKQCHFIDNLIVFSRSGVEINFSDVNIVTEVEHFLPREQIFAP